jgi:hypothetical protein
MLLLLFLPTCLPTLSLASLYYDTATLRDYASPRGGRTFQQQQRRDPHTLLPSGPSHHLTTTNQPPTQSGTEITAATIKAALRTARMAEGCLTWSKRFRAHDGEGAEAGIRGHNTDALLMRGCGSPSTYIASLTSARSRRAALRGSSGSTAVWRHTPNTPLQNFRSGTRAHVRSRTEESRVC